MQIELNVADLLQRALKESDYGLFDHAHQQRMKSEASSGARFVGRLSNLLCAYAAPP
mgnify:CR=1 FL=1